MAMNVQKQPHGATTVLDLPYEVIMHICSHNALTTTDIYNLAMSHSKLNDCLFGEQNSSLWKAKYEQKYFIFATIHILYPTNNICDIKWFLLKLLIFFNDDRYDDSNINEFDITVTDHNTWRTEIMLRMNLNKAVTREIMQMPSKYLRFKNIPYHVYPFGEELNSNNQNCQYYIYRSSLDFYKHMSSPWYFSSSILSKITFDLPIFYRFSVIIKIKMFYTWHDNF